MTRLGAFVLAASLALGYAAQPASGADRSSIATVAKPAATGAPWTPAEIAAVREQIDRAFAHAPGLRGAHAGLLAVDARTGTVIYARSADDEFIPASNAKLVTGSAALARLGPQFRFHTEALTNGPVVDGTLEGTLVIRAGGDPLLGVHDLDDLVAALKRAGIVRLSSAPVVDAAYFDAQPYPEGWSWDDFPFDYAPVVSAATFEENVVHLTVSPGATTGAPATVAAAPYGQVDAGGAACLPTADVHVITSVRTGARSAASSVDLRRDPGGCIDVVGTIPLGSAPLHPDAAVPSPSAYLRGALLARLAAAGIGVVPPVATGEAPVAAAVALPPLKTPPLWSHASEPLAELLADFWYPSDNLVGELLLKALGVAHAGVPGTTATGLALESDFLRSAGVDPSTVDLHDGSGLSRYSRMTPRALVALLEYDWHAPFRTTVLDALPVAGVRGTLAHAYVGTPVERRLFAKTGGMLDVTNLSGYLATKRHGALTFSFLIGDALGDDAAIARTRAQILSALTGG